MLSVFPEILFLSPFAPTLLRVAAGIVLLIVAWTHYERRNELGQEKFIVVGQGMWIPVFAALVEFLTAVGLILGTYTQAVAIVGALLALKHLLWRGHYPNFFPLSRSASMLLLAICLSLIVTGAGAFAFDLPL